MRCAALTSKQSPTLQAKSLLGLGVHRVNIFGANVAIFQFLSQINNFLIFLVYSGKLKNRRGGTIYHVLPAQ